MNVLSLFNGISAMHLALDRAEIEYGTVYYAEIDKYANQVTQQHYPQDISLGDVTKWQDWDIDWASIGLVGAGFPCQAWSVAGKQLGDKDERGMLFWTTLEIIANVLKHNPNAKFLMENVKMKKDFEEYITHHTTQALGYVEKTLINSALVSAQNRNRYYWTNFKIEQPQDKGILLADVLEQPMDEKYNLSNEAVARFQLYDKPKGNCVGTTKREGNIGQRDECYGVNGKMGCLTATMYKQPPQYVVREKSQTLLATLYKENAKSMVQRNKMGLVVGELLDQTETSFQKDDITVRATVQANAEHTSDGKVPTLTASMGMGGGNVPLYTDKDIALQFKGKYIDKNERLHYRKLTPTECARLQTFPDGWAESIVSKTQAYKAYGNAWTVDVIVHILKQAFDKEV